MLKSYAINQGIELIAANQPIVWAFPLAKLGE
jgi:hypothetical protein